MVCSAEDALPAQMRVRPDGNGTQQFAHGIRSKFTPLDAESAFAPASHVSVDNRRFVLRP